MVNATALAEVADEIELGEWLLLGKGEDAAGGRQKPSILSDAFEAVIGAVYLDGGVEVGEALVARLFSERLDDAAGRLDRLDHKTVLQELTARLFDTAPVYLLTESRSRPRQAPSRPRCSLPETRSGRARDGRRSWPSSRRPRKRSTPSSALRVGDA